MADFNEERAKALIHAYRLKPDTIKSWRHLKRIPDKYNVPLVPLREVYTIIPIEWLDTYLDTIHDRKKLSEHIDTTLVPYGTTIESVKARLRSYAQYERIKLIENAPDNYRRIYAMMKEESGKSELYFMEFFNTKNVNEIISKLIEIAKWEMSAGEIYTTCPVCGYLNPNDDAPDAKHCESCKADLFPSEPNEY